LVSLGVAHFSIGRIIQFIDHYFEERQPAFIDDMMGVAIGPLFIAVELAFLCGLCKALRTDI